MASKERAINGKEGVPSFKYLQIASFGMSITSGVENTGKK
jgi:hypothetical protein